MLVNDPRPAFDEIANGVKVFTDGDLLVSDVRPLNQNGRVLVPMRAIFEKLRASVSWDAATETATAVKDGIEVKITKNQTTAYKNGEPIILDVPATILNGRFVVPVRFISESFGCQVGWVGDKNAVTVKIPKDNGIKAYDGVSSNGGRAIASVTQSGDDGYGSNVSRIFDNDKNTLWMARCEDESNPPYIIIDLGENAAPENLEVSFYQGKSRTYYYSVYTSTDNVSFAPLMTDKSTTRADGFEKISLNGMNARYIKLVVKGSSFGSWALIEELRVK